MLNRSKSQDCKLSYPSITIVQKKGYFYKVINSQIGKESVLIIVFHNFFQTSPKERRKQFRKIRRSQSMDFEDPEEIPESRLFKLLSETDIQVYNNCQYFMRGHFLKLNQESGLKSCDSRDIVVSDIFVKVIIIFIDIISLNHCTYNFFCRCLRTSCDVACACFSISVLLLSQRPGKNSVAREQETVMVSAHMLMVLMRNP